MSSQATEILHAISTGDRSGSDQLAREKFLHSNDTVDEISESLGYSSQENFIRAFYRWSSISPAEFRRQGRM
jgi:AraC-like DNA-binding protein